MQGEIKLQAFRATEVFGYPSFLEGQLGFRTQGQLGDEIRLDFAFGVHARPDVLILAQSFSDISPRTPPGAAALDQKFQLSAVYNFTPKIAMQLGVLDAPIGWNSVNERGVTAALWVRF